MRKEQIILQRIADFIHSNKQGRKREATVAMITPYLSEGLNIPKGTIKQVMEEMLSHADVMNDLEDSAKPLERNPKRRIE